MKSVQHNSRCIGKVMPKRPVVKYFVFLNYEQPKQPNMDQCFTFMHVRTF